MLSTNNKNNINLIIKNHITNQNLTKHNDLITLMIE